MRVLATAFIHSAIAVEEGSSLLQSFHVTDEGAVAMQAGENLIEDKEGVEVEDGEIAICGQGEEIISTDCLGDSLVKKQARATAKMTMGGCCTAWLVKGKTANTGALMLTTGHCATSQTADFQFDYYTKCNDTAKNHGPKCRGTKRNAETSKDEQGIYELALACKVADTIDPILLDVGVPPQGEGMYVIGHPNCRPSLLSHEEVHDKGDHCKVTSTFNRRGSRRISYVCDTQGGNSGSPVFSARTGYAFAIHSHGGCHAGGGANSGGLLANTGVKAAFDLFGIPYVDRAKTNIFAYDSFSPHQCRTSPENHVLAGKNLQECKDLCINSLTCVGVEHSSTSCKINYRSGGIPTACPSGVTAFKKDKTLTVSLLHQGAPTTTTTTAPSLAGLPSRCGSNCCNFETDLCDWVQSTGDKFDWTRKRGPTPSSSTGPTAAAKGDYYMYVETSSPRRKGDTAILKKTVQIVSGARMSFAYHMLGTTMGTLKVLVNGAKVWSESGSNPLWRAADIDLGSYDGQTVRIEFFYTRGSSWQGDAAIDWVSVDGLQPAPATTTITTTKQLGSFATVTSGTCDSNGFLPIYDSLTCSSAAQALGFSISWGPHGGYPDVVGGCSVRRSFMLFIQPKGKPCNEGSISGSCSCAQSPNKCLCQVKTTSATTVPPGTVSPGTLLPATKPPGTNPPTATTQAPTTGTNSLKRGDTLFPGSLITSPNGQCMFGLTKDGEFGLEQKRCSPQQKESMNPGQPASKLEFDKSDGKIWLTTAFSTWAVWPSGNAGNAQEVVINDKCQVVVLDGDGNTMDTWGRECK